MDVVNFRNAQRDEFGDKGMMAGENNDRFIGDDGFLYHVFAKKMK